MKNESLVSISDFSKEEILELLDNMRYFEANPNRRLLEGKVVATLFFEPSTRTRLSFETAVNRLGGRIIGFSDASTTSSSKGETLKDTIKMVSNYVDLIIMRHYLEGAARYASEVSRVPIINAGDGANQHPSQTMLDLYSIYKTQGRLTDLTITMVGDLKYGRTVHSLLMAMYYFNPTFNFVACDELKMPQEYKDFCEQHGIKYTEGLQYPSSIKDGYFEPFITINEEEKKVLYADPAKKTWRNLQSLLSAVYHGDHDSPYRCMQMVKFWQRTVSTCDCFNLWTGGLRVRTNSGDQSVKQSDDYVESEIRLRSKDLGTNFFLDFCNGMKRIDSYALLLRDNMKKYFKAMKSGDASSAKAVAYYWMAADEVSDDFMDACNADDGKKSDMVMSHLYGVMLGLYDAFCPHETGRQIMIWIKYRPFTGGAKMIKSDKYVDYVFSRIKDKAMAADLRHGDNSAYSVKAAARIHRFVDIGNDTQVRIYTLIGSAIVKSGQKENGTCGLGNAYWRIYHDTCREDEFPHRLERLLACDDIDELLDLLRQSLSLIRSKGIQLDFARLLREVESFSSCSEKRNQVRASWASDYFNRGDVIDE